MEIKLQPHSYYKYTLAVTKTQLTLTDDKTPDELFYDYSLDVKLTYEDGTSENQVIDGQIYLAKVDNKWLVNGVHERTSVTPDKKYYNPPARFLHEGPEATFINDSYKNFTDSKSLCDAYIQAMLDSDFNFIANHTANSSKKNNLDEGQRLWDTIKINSVEIITSEERVSSHFKNMSKAYYELKIDVADPGNSVFKKGENIRWLYLFSANKDDTTYWITDGLMTSGKPDELWWDSIYGS